MVAYLINYVLNIKTFNRPTFTLNQLNVLNVNQSKHLGIVNSETSCNQDLKRQMCKLYTNVNMII